MEETVLVKALIIKRQPHKESDSRVWVYTPQYGQLELLARGTQKLGSKLAAHIEPFNLVDLMIIKGQKRHYVGSAITRKAFGNIKADFNKTHQTGLAFNFFNKIVKPEQADQDLFTFVVGFLEIMEEQGDKDELLNLVFTWKLLAFLGYRPELHTCLECREPILVTTNKLFFSTAGVLCQKCVQLKNSGFSPINTNHLKLLRFILDNDLAKITNLQIDSRLFKDLKNLTQKMVIYHTN